MCCPCLKAMSVFFYTPQPLIGQARAGFQQRKITAAGRGTNALAKTSADSASPCRRSFINPPQSSVSIFYTPLSAFERPRVALQNGRSFKGAARRCRRQNRLKLRFRLKQRHTGAKPPHGATEHDSPKTPLNPPMPLQASGRNAPSCQLFLQILCAASAHGHPENLNIGFKIKNYFWHKLC